MKTPKIEVTRDGVWIDGEKAKRIYTGGERKCYVARGIIVKLNDWRRQSSRELRRWAQVIDDNDKQYFAPPIAGKIRGHGWIAQRIVKFKRGRRPNWSYALAAEIMQSYGIKDAVIEEWSGRITPVNWGISENGQLVIYDWGW